MQMPHATILFGVKKKEKRSQSSPLVMPTIGCPATIFAA